MINVLNNPIITIKLTNMRDKNSNHYQFRQNLSEIASLMVYEILKNYKTKEKTVVTPLNEKYVGAAFDKEIVFVPILRAGLGMVDGLLKLVPEARVGHIGLYRDEKTFEPQTYYYKMPNVSKDSYIFVVDPMLATGNSAIDAIKKLKADKFTNIHLVCLVGAPVGAQKVIKEFGENFQIYLAALDKKLNEKNYISPGLGDAGDRIFGTK